MKGDADRNGYVTFTEARELLGVASKDTLRRIVNRQGWQVYSNPRDARERWLKRSDIKAYLQPKPRPE